MARHVVLRTTINNTVRMATVVDDLEQFVSQEGPTIVSQVLTEPVDFSQMGGPTLAEMVAMHGNLDENEDSQENSQALTRDAAADPSQGNSVADPAVPVLRKKRKRLTFANKKLLADRELFMLPEFFNQFTDDGVKIHGKITKCAIKKDRHSRYVIDWKKPYPQGLNPLWLKKEHENTDAQRDKLQTAILSYEDLPANEKNSRAKTRQSRRTPRPAAPVPASASVAAASVRTSSSTVSTLTRSTISTTQQSTQLSQTSSTAGTRRSTRSSEDIESDSDDEYGELQEEEEPTPVRPDLLYEHSEEEREEDRDGNPASSVFQMLNQFEWTFEPVEPGTDMLHEGPLQYNGPVGLKPGVAESFSDPMDCLSANGLSRVFVARLARNSNEYARKFILPKDRNSRLHGHEWKNISIDEMFVFLGITLRISLSPMDSGGYGAYFRKTNKEVFGEVIYGTKGFARKYMKLWRYKQIRAALHPDDRKAASMDGSDKAFMLRHALNTLNAASMNVMYIGYNLTFDEGGTASRHRRNPIRQFNGAKPQKFRIDYFLLCDSNNYFIHHCDVYQGKNASEVNIHRDVHGVPTTQKVVLNAVLQTRMHECVDGARHLVMDNRYQCPQLAALLLKRYDLYSTGTSRLGRVGWNKEYFNLKKKQPKGTTKLMVDKVNGVLCVQWVDSKVVQCVSTKMNAKIGVVGRQVAHKKQPVPCPEAIIDYQEHMFGVDKGDQIRAHGGGFSSKAHYQKWYKKGFFAILDMMLMNAYISWNVAARDYPRYELPRLSRHDFYWYIAQRMLNCTSQSSCQQSPQKRQSNAAIAGGHKPERTSSKTICAVCKLDWNIVRKKLGKEPPQAGLTRDVARCQACGITAHALPCTTQRTIHSLAEFEGLTCFEIAHTSKGFGIWVRSDDDVLPDAAGKKRSYSLKTAHPTYLELAAKIGAVPKRRGGSVSNATTTRQDNHGLSSSSDSDDEDSRPQPLRLTNVQAFHNNDN